MSAEQGLRVVLPGKNPLYGWATSAPGNDINPPGGYTVIWEDDWEDHPDTRWYLDSGDIMEIKAV